MNYKIILDENLLKEFIDFLPELKLDECYYVSLFSRNKYDTTGTLKASKQNLKRFTSNKEMLLHKIKQLECPYGSYVQNENPIPNESLALYININPRSLKKAKINSIKKLVDNLDNDSNPYKIVLSEIQKAKSRTIYYDFDFDGVDFEKTKSEIFKFINEEACNFLMTRGGFHLLIKVDTISNEYKKNWYNNLIKIDGCDIKGDNLIPIPGTSQGLFVPYFT